MLNDYIGWESSGPFVSGINPGHDEGTFFLVQIFRNRLEKSVPTPVRNAFLRCKLYGPQRSSLSILVNGIRTSATTFHINPAQLERVNKASAVLLQDLQDFLKSQLH